MLYKLKGILREVLPPNRILLESGSILYEIYIPFKLVDILKNGFLNQKIELYTIAMIQKNEFIELYGFLEREERELFIKLNRLSKIGPKLALNLLSLFSPETLKEVVIQRKVKELSKVPGIGEKRAEKLLLELKGLFGKLSRKGFTIPIEKEGILIEAKECLVNLGFQEREVEEILFKVFDEKDTLEELLKKVLKQLAPTIQEVKPE